MKLFFQCVVEAVLENGIKGLAEMVPGGKFAVGAAEGVWKKWKEKKQERKLHDEVVKVAAASFEKAAAEAVEQIKPAVAALPPGVPPPTESEIIDLQLFCAAIPDAVRQSLKRPEDPTGRSVPDQFALNSAEDVLKLFPPRPPRFRPGAALPGKPGWVLDRLLGTGGFGEVWFAKHTRLDNLHGAVKFCFGQTGQDLIHEGDLINRVMSAGRHPNIVPLNDAHLEGECPWLLFEYVGGGTLTDWIYHLQRMTPADRLKQAQVALAQLCEAVGHFHALPVPVVHRDLKPSNILLDRTTKKLRITDFGIGSVTAKETNREESRGGGTRGGRLLSYLRGSHTPLYSSPQQRSGADPDPRDDVHALGVIAYQMLTGHLAQGAGPDFAEDLRDAGAGEELIALLGKCVAQKPDRRPRDGGVVSRELLKVQPPEPYVPTEGVRRHPPPKDRDEYELTGWGDGLPATGETIPLQVSAPDVRENLKERLRAVGDVDLETIPRRARLVGTFTGVDSFSVHRTQAFKTTRSGFSGDAVSEFTEGLEPPAPPNAHSDPSGGVLSIVRGRRIQLVDLVSGSVLLRSKGKGKHTPYFVRMNGVPARLVSPDAGVVKVDRSVTPPPGSRLTYRLTRPSPETDDDGEGERMQVDVQTERPSDEIEYELEVLDSGGGSVCHDEWYSGRWLGFPEWVSGEGWGVLEIVSEYRPFRVFDSTTAEGRVEWDSFDLPVMVRPADGSGCLIGIRHGFGVADYPTGRTFQFTGFRRHEAACSVSALAWSADKRLVATTDDLLGLLVWELGERELVPRFTLSRCNSVVSHWPLHPDAHESRVVHIEFAADDTRLVTLDMDMTLNVWDLG